LLSHHHVFVLTNQILLNQLMLPDDITAVTRPTT